MLPAELPHSSSKLPRLPEQMRLKARQCIADFVEKARAEQHVRMAMPTVCFDLRGKAAGQAFLQKNHIRVNPILFAENEEAFYHRTLPHEVAHLVAWQLYREGGHGEAWKKVMRAFGKEPSRCHSYDVTNAATSTTHAFRCACRTHPVSTRQLRAALLGGLGCKKCRQRLTPQDPQALTSVLLELKGGRALVRLLGPQGNPGCTLPRPMAHPGAAQGRVPPSSAAAPPAGTPASQSTPGAVRPPTPAMLSFAQSLAIRAGLSMPALAHKEYSHCAQFIEATKLGLIAKARAATPPAGAGTGAGATTGAQGAGGVANDDLPTEKQLAFARAIALRRGLRIPPDAGASRRELSRWIDANR